MTQKKAVICFQVCKRLLKRCWTRGILKSRTTRSFFSSMVRKNSRRRCCQRAPSGTGARIFAFCVFWLFEKSKNAFRKKMGNALDHFRDLAESDSTLDWLQRHLVAGHPFGRKCRKINLDLFRVKCQHIILSWSITYHLIWLLLI